MVPLARWQKGEACVRRVSGVIHIAGGFADAVIGVDVYDRGKRDAYVLLSCSHYRLI